MIKLQDILLETQYGTYANNAQNKALKRVGNKYGSTSNTPTPNIKIPKFNVPKMDVAAMMKKTKAKAAKLKSLYGNKDRKANVKNGVDIIKDGKDLEHFLYDFKSKGNVVGDMEAYDIDMDNQYAKQKQKLSPKERKQLESDAIGWKKLGGYEAIQQAIKNGDVSEQDIRSRNKRISDISHKTVTKVQQPIERGMEIDIKDAKQFLSRFKVGEDIEIPDGSGHGASGFSTDKNVARDFADADNIDPSMVSVTLSIEPNSKGELRGLYVDGENKKFSSEAEITRSSKSKAVVKEIKKIKHPNGKMQYIIVMQDPEDLTTESITTEAKESDDGLSKKYLEGPINNRKSKPVTEGMIKLTTILNEGKTVSIFDFDDTIAQSDSWVYILKGGKVIKKLDPAEFAVYTPKAGEEYDFRDFDRKLRNPRLIKKNADLLKKQLKKGGRKVTILTARRLKAPINHFFKTIGIQPYVVTLGSADPQKKAEYIENEIKKGYTTIYFMDDSVKNIRAVDALKRKYPNVKLITKLA